MHHRYKYTDTIGYNVHTHPHRYTTACPWIYDAVQLNAAEEELLRLAEQRMCRCGNDVHKHTRYMMLPVCHRPSNSGARTQYLIQFEAR